MPPKPAKILYFPMEIASRELDSRLLLAAIAASYGFEVVLGQKWLIERNIAHMTPGVYLSKTLTRRDARMLKRAKECGYITAAIDEEIAGLVVHDHKFWWVSRDAVENADMIFLPGTYNSTAFAACFDVGAARLRRVANPRWDLLREELRSIFAQEVADLLRRYGDFILVNTNLGTINSKKGDARHMIQGLIDQGKIDPNDAELLRDLDHIIAMEEANRTTLIELLPRMARRFPKYRIILRPHPSEEVENWRKWLPDCPQIEIVREGAAVPWILASRVLVHTNCTTGVEAIALDKPSICVVPTETPANQRYLANRVNPVTKDATDTIAEIERVLSAPERCYNHTMLACFHDNLSYEPNQLGAKTLIRDILALGNARGWREPSGNSSDWRAYSGYRWRQRDKNVRGDLFPRDSFKNVETRLGQYAKVLKLDVRLKVQHCGSKVILLSGRSLNFATRIRRAIGL